MTPQLQIPGVDDASAVLLLSIHKEHADRLFRNEKLYELRKVLPKTLFHRVYLYESGGGGVVGCFDVAEVIGRPKKELWRAVGERATTKERFDAYFSKSSEGFAIRAANPVRFRTPLRPPRLKEFVPAFTAPQSFLLIRPGHPLYGVLRDAAAQQREAPRVRLAPIRPTDRPEYVALVTRHVGKNYEDISDSFAHQALSISDAGQDKSGFLTRKKEVLRVEDESGGLVGYTTLTYKRGGAIKTGPTIMLPRFVGRGYGGATRVAIEEYARTRETRKLYCTCPDTAPQIVSYLLRAGYRIEAHLSGQYSPDHGELVFGRMLQPEGKAIVPRKRRSVAAGTVCDVNDLPAARVTAALTKLFAGTWFAVTIAFAKRLRKSPPAKGTSYEAKPREVLLLRNGNRCVGAAIMIPKRGRAVKALLLTETTHRTSIERLISSVEGWARTNSFRKVFYLHPLADSLVTEILQRMAYRPEGILAEPYVRGQSVIVLSRHL